MAIQPQRTRNLWKRDSGCRAHGEKVVACFGQALPMLAGPQCWALKGLGGGTEKIPGCSPHSTAHKAPVGSALDTLVGSLAKRHIACHVLTRKNNE